MQAASDHPSFPSTEDSLAATFFDQRAKIETTSNRLQHWQQRASTIFLTFRLADSIPRSILHDWKQQRDIWLSTNPKPHSACQTREYRERFTIPFDNTLDQGHGEQHLANPKVRTIVAGALRYFDYERYQLHAYVLMPTHVHILATFIIDHPLNKVLGSWKSYSAREINRLLHRKSRFWQTDYFDRIIRNFNHYERCLNYIDANPTRANLSSDAFTLYQREDPFFNASREI